jgi:hypothetical protein
MQAHQSQFIEQSILQEIEDLRFAWMPRLAGFMASGFFAVAVLRLSLIGLTRCHFGLTRKPLSALSPRRRLGSGSSDLWALGFSETSTLALVGSHAMTPALRCS